MIIYINGVKINISEFDDVQTILEIYSLKKGNGSIPAYFYITNKDYRIEKGVKLEVSDIRDDLESISLDENMVLEIEKLIPYYPLMNDDTYWRFSGRTAITILYLISHDITTTDVLGSVENLDIIQAVDINLSRLSSIKKSITDYLTAVKKQLGNIKVEQETRKGIYNKIKGVEGVETSSYNIDKITIAIPLILPNNENIFMVFDSIITSVLVPLAILTIRGYMWIKVYKHINIPDKWLKIKQDKKGNIVDGITIRVSNTDIDNIAGDSIDAYYSVVKWLSNNTVVVKMKGVGDVSDYEDVKQNLFQAIDPHLEYKKLPDITSDIKGTFRMEGVNFNRAVIADMVMTNEIFSYFFFANESDQTVLEKSRFYLYFQHDQNGDIKNSITISITPKKLKARTWLEVRVSQATSLAEVNSFIYVFSKLMGIYSVDYKSVLSLYKSLLGAEKVKFYATKEMVKSEDQKTGYKLKLLKQRNPRIFKTNYTCQQNRHPDHKYRSEIESVDRNVMEWPFESDEYYDCQTNSGDVFPGLIINNDPTTKKDYPLVPCCFATDQMKKGTSNYSMYLSTANKMYEDGETDLNKITRVASQFAVNEIVKRRTKETRPLNQDKSLEADRRGKLPYYIQLLFEMAGYEKIAKYDNIPSIPVLRLGVINSPASFIHCLEAAFNEDYLSSAEDIRDNMVEKTLKKMSKMNFSYAKQELYDLSNKEIRRLLKQPSTFIDPAAFVSLAMLYYTCNIFMYRIDEEHKNGQILIPRFSQAYLMRSIYDDLPTVFIIEQKLSGQSYPYQCEIVGIMDITNERVLDFKFIKDLVADKAFQILQESNQVTIVTPDGAQYYTPVDALNKLYRGVISQTIDSHGKCRVLNYKNVSLVVSPIPPLNVPSRKYLVADIDDVHQFIKVKKLEIYSQDGEEGRIQGLWVKSQVHGSGIYYGYIPVEETDALDVDYSTEEDPLRTGLESELHNFHQDQKIAEILEQYTLFEYSRDQENFSRQSYIVIRDHTYDIESLEKRLLVGNTVIYSAGKIIVTSEIMIDKLMFYLNTQILNDSPGIDNYGKRKVLQGYYKNVSDFLERSDELIFSSVRAFSNWKTENEEVVRTNTIYNTFQPFDIEPYYYRSFSIQNSRLCIIQNVVGGNLRSALFISSRWSQDQVNYGFTPNVPGTFSEELSYKIYYVSGVDEKVGDSPKLAVVDYGGENYAAMLFL